LRTVGDTHRSEGQGTALTGGTAATAQQSKFGVKRLTRLVPSVFARRPSPTYRSISGSGHGITVWWKGVEVEESVGFV